MELSVWMFQASDTCAYALHLKVRHTVQGNRDKLIKTSNISLLFSPTRIIVCVHICNDLTNLCKPCVNYQADKDFKTCCEHC